METPMRHRIIGSVVWLSAAIIVLPFILDGEGLKDLPQTPRQITVPVPLHIEPIEMEQVDPAKPIALTSTVPTASQQVATQPKLVTNDQPALDAQGLPKAWVVQLASFKSKDYADALRDKLIKDQYAAYMQAHNNNYRVFVGPVNTRSEADELQAKLQQGYKLRGYVTAYKINKSAR